MRRLTLWIVMRCALASNALARGGLWLLETDAQRKPPQRATPEPIAVPGPIEAPTAIKPQAWRLPTPQEIDRARGECAAHGLPQLRICRGPGKACARVWNEQGHCPDCYIVAWHDRRPSAEIIAAMERGDA
jgi:hypothetical protein